MPADVPANLCKLNYPITTELQMKFWGSRHKCNRMKSIISFSLDLQDASDNLRRHGYKLLWRQKAIFHFGQYVNTPDMVGMPFTPMEVPWWKCMPYAEIPPVPPVPPVPIPLPFQVDERLYPDTIFPSIKVGDEIYFSIEDVGISAPRRTNSIGVYKYTGGAISEKFRDIVPFLTRVGPYIPGWFDTTHTVNVKSSPNPGIWDDTVYWDDRHEWLEV